MSEFTIYTIDDDIDFNVVLSMAMKNYDVKVKTHTNPQSFTESVRDKMPDLCILDLNLDHDGEGFQLLKAMRNVLGEDLPIFVMSKRGTREDVLKAMEFGADDFIPKPLDDKYLLLKLKDYIHSNREIQELSHTYSKVSENDREAIITMSFKVTKVGIDIFEIEGEEFLTKDMNLIIKGNLLNDIFNEDKLSFKVVESWQVEETKFGAKLEKELNQEQLFSLRRWLIHDTSKTDTKE